MNVLPGTMVCSSGYTFCSIQYTSTYIYLKKSSTAVLRVCHIFLRVYEHIYIRLVYIERHVLPGTVSISFVMTSIYDSQTDRSRPQSQSEFRTRDHQFELDRGEG